MAKRITPADKLKINQLYYQYHTYAEVARQLQLSPGTVKKYVDPTWEPIDYSQYKIMHLEDVPEFDPTIFRGVDNYGTLCCHSDEEKAEIEQLWKELSV